MPAVELEVTDLQERLSPLGVHDVRPLSGGASSLTYRATMGEGARVVVKVAPPGVPPTLNRDVLRQARVLRVLHDTPVPVPEVLAEDPGEPPDVPPLFVMSFIDGGSLEPLFDLDGEEDKTVVSARIGNAARTLAALHAVDPRAVGLGGEQRVGPGDEIVRWCRLLETVEPNLAPGWDAVAAALRASEPPAMADAVVHGDFRLGNMLATGADITAVIDWEIWTVGDPRVDVGWFLANADPATYRRPTRYARSLPPPAELADGYTAALGCDVASLAWFQALACFKSSATWSLIVKHSRRRTTPDSDFEAMVPVLPHLLDRARELLS
jgi:aminoglycoside phosphotransferase (APT) family kinase protein